MIGSRGRVCLSAVLIAATAQSCSGEGKDGKELSQEELLAVLKTTGEFKQPDGTYVIKAKRVDGRNLVGVEVVFVSTTGTKVKVSSESALLKINDRKQLELVFDECEVEDQGRRLTMIRQQYTFPAPLMTPKLGTPAVPKENGKEKK